MNGSPPCKEMSALQKELTNSEIPGQYMFWWPSLIGIVCSHHQVTEKYY